MYQGSHVPNFEALGITKSKWQASTHIVIIIIIINDTAASHNEGFNTETFIKRSRKLPSMVTIHHHKHECTCFHKNFPGANIRTHGRTHGHRAIESHP